MLAPTSPIAKRGSFMYSTAEAADRMGVDVKTFRRNQWFGLTPARLQSGRLWDSCEVVQVALELGGRPRGAKTRPFFALAEEARRQHEARVATTLPTAPHPLNCQSTPSRPDFLRR